MYLVFLCSTPSSVLYANAFALCAIYSVIIFPSNSSLKRLITFLFLTIGNGLLLFISYFDVSNHLSTSLAISIKNFQF